MISNPVLHFPTAQSIAAAKAAMQAERDQFTRETGLSIEEQTGKLLGLALVRIVSPKEH